MLVLSFKIFDSFFVGDIFYQILPNELQDGCLIRSMNGTLFALKESNSLKLQEECSAKLSSPVSACGEFKIAFDAPRTLKISRSSLLIDDEFEESLVVASASERTIDQLLEEEFMINPSFAQEFIQKCFSSALLQNVDVVTTHRSARQQYSGGDESDVIVIFSHNKKAYGLLIENKINADKQHRQPERYIERGINGIKGGLWDNFETCLIAPKQYLKTKKNKDYYHNYISYEDIIEILDKTVSEENRKQFRIQQFEAAISKKGLHVRAPDIPEAVQFVEEFKSLCKKQLPEMTFFTGPANNKVLWFYFSKDNYPEGVKIIVKMDVVTMEFKLPVASRFVEGNEALLKKHGYDFLMAKSGKSCTIRKSIEPISAIESFEDQKHNLLKCIDFIKELDAFFRSLNG